MHCFKVWRQKKISQFLLGFIVPFIWFFFHHYPFRMENSRLGSWHNSNLYHTLFIPEIELLSLGHLHTFGMNICRNANIYLEAECIQKELSYFCYHFWSVLFSFPTFLLIVFISWFTSWLFGNHYCSTDSWYYHLFTGFFRWRKIHVSE